MRTFAWKRVPWMETAARPELVSEYDLPANWRGKWTQGHRNVLVRHLGLGQHFLYTSRSPYKRETHASCAHMRVPWNGTQVHGLEPGCLLSTYDLKSCTHVFRWRKQSNCLKALAIPEKTLCRLFQLVVSTFTEKTWARSLTVFIAEWQTRPSGQAW